MIWDVSACEALLHVGTPLLPAEVLERGTHGVYERLLRQARFRGCRDLLFSVAREQKVTEDDLLSAMADVAALAQAGDGTGRCETLELAKLVVTRIPGVGRVRRRRLRGALEVFLRQQLPSDGYNLGVREQLLGVSSSARPVDVTVRGERYAMRIRTGMSPVAWLYRLATPEDAVHHLLATVETNGHPRDIRVAPAGAQGVVHECYGEFGWALVRAWDDRETLSLLLSHAGKTS